MADAVIKASKKPYKRIEIDKRFISIKADPKLIAKLKKI